METKYRLKKDIPELKAGTIFCPISALAYGYIVKGAIHIEFAKEYIENNPEWWEKVEEVKVTDFGKLRAAFGEIFYQFRTTHPIPPERYPHIMSLIEKELNK